MWIIYLVENINNILIILFFLSILLLLISLVTFIISENINIIKMMFILVVIIFIFVGIIPSKKTIIEMYITQKSINNEKIDNNIIKILNRNLEEIINKEVK